MIKYIEKVIIHKTVNEKEYDIYPRTSADNVTYSGDITIKKKMQEIENKINELIKEQEEYEKENNNSNE
mgnify:CR=1 FL=1